MNENNLLDVINSPFSSDLQREQARAALDLLNNLSVTPVNLVPPVKPGETPDYDWLAALADTDIFDEGSAAREKWLSGAEVWLDAIVTGPYTAEQKAAAQERYAWQVEGVKTAAMVESDARFANIRAECNFLAKTLFPNEDPRHDLTSHLVDRVLNNIWPAAWGKCPTGQWDGGPIAAPGVSPAPIPEPKVTSAGPSDIEKLIAEERRLLDQRDAEASRKWNAQMGLRPDFQPTDNKGHN